jgi:hypothetical protein
MSPRKRFSAPTKMMEAAISGSTIRLGICTSCRVATASVIECAIVNEVMIFSAETKTPVTAQSCGDTLHRDNIVIVSTKLQPTCKMATQPRPMNTLLLTCFALALLAASSFAGEIYGTITQDGKPVGKDVAVTIEIGGQSYSKVTDEFGSYRIFVAESGKGTVKIAFKKQNISGEIESYSTPVRFDLAIENKDGHYALRRQ